jgi:hypothetical protein
MKCAVIRSYGGLTQNERYIGNNLKHAGKAAEWRPDPQRELADEGSATGGNRGQEQQSRRRGRRLLLQGYSPPAGYGGKLQLPVLANMSLMPQASDAHLPGPGSGAGRSTSEKWAVRRSNLNHSHRRHD